MKLCSTQELDVIKTFECGQCFRWNCGDDGVYRGVVAGYYAEASVKDREVYITSDAPEDIWQQYFDLGTDYAEISRAFTGEYLSKCVEYGRGIRILPAGQLGGTVLVHYIAVQ